MNGTTLKPKYTALDYAAEIQGRYDVLIEELSSLNDQVAPRQTNELYMGVRAWWGDFNAGQRATIKKLLKEKLGITAADIERDTKNEREKSKEGGTALSSQSGKEVNLKHGGDKQERRAQSIVEDRVCYRTNRGYIVAGGHIEEDETNCPLYHFSTKGHIRFLDGEQPKISETYDKVVDRLSRHVVWKRPHHAKVVGLWIMGTYFASIFTWYAYLWLTSPARRCGKSLLLELVSLLAYNATPILTNPRPAYLYRTVDINFPTVIIDELTKFKGDGGDDYTEILSLLNAGAKAGSVVARMEKIGEKYEAKYYHAFCPKALAGLVSLPETLNDRVLRMDMSRKKAEEKVERLNLRKMGKELAALRDVLYLTGLGYDKDVTEFYDNIEKLDIPQELDDRLRDITEPLFALAGAIDAEKGEVDATTALKAYTQELAGAKGADDHADSAQHTVRALLKLGLEPEGEGSQAILSSKKVLGLFEQEPELAWCDTPWKAGRLINRLGFNSRPHRVGSTVVRGYKLRYRDLQDLRERYLAEGENT
ncbi:MAG: DUF3631 domain-containing protein [Candidatus Brocadiales bacterium]|nr:DUF3631 domain-containing protein [Candidatus Bathyanammoxibius amoris]